MLENADKTSDFAWPIKGENVITSSKIEGKVVREKEVNTITKGMPQQVKRS